MHYNDCRMQKHYTKQTPKYPDNSFAKTSFINFLKTCKSLAMCFPVVNMLFLCLAIGAVM